MMPVTTKILVMGLMCKVTRNENITLIMIIVASMIVRMIVTTQFQDSRNKPVMIVVVIKIVNAPMIVTTPTMININCSLIVLPLIQQRVNGKMPKPNETSMTVIMIKMTYQD